MIDFRFGKKVKSHEGYGFRRIRGSVVCMSIDRNHDFRIPSRLECNYKKSYNLHQREMKYEWDNAKNRKNFAKHGLSFEDAEQVLDGPCVTFEDDRYAYGEERLVTLGLLAERLVVIAHSPRAEERALSP
jgi:uncharacterized protein